MEFTQEQIKNKYESLPEDIKKAVSSVDTTDTLINIGEKYKLHVDKMGDLVDETTLVMLGLKPTGNFVGNVQKRLNISRDLSENIVRDINEKILLKVRESLRKIHEEKDEKTDPLVVLKEIQPIIKPIIKPVTDEQKIKSTTSFETIENESVVKPVVKETELKPIPINTNLNLNKVKPEIEEDLKREDILKEIEQPITDSNISDSIESSSMNNNQTNILKKEEIKKEEKLEMNISEEKIKSLEETTKVSDKDELSLNVQKKPMISPNIIENKLTQTTKEPLVEENVFVDNKSEVKTKKPAVDPYREPIE